MAKKLAVVFVVSLHIILCCQVWHQVADATDCSKEPPCYDDCEPDDCVCTEVNSDDGSGECKSISEVTGENNPNDCSKEPPCNGPGDCKIDGCVCVHGDSADGLGECQNVNP